MGSESAEARPIKVMGLPRPIDAIGFVTPKHAPIIPLIDIALSLVVHAEVSEIAVAASHVSSWYARKDAQI